MNNFIGIIIEESLEKKGVLEKMKIIQTDIEPTTEAHNTPWVNQWTLHTVEVLENQANNISKEISAALDSQHNWYADFKNKEFHCIIFHNKVFKVDRSQPGKYDEVIKYGISLGIPDYQLDFSPHIKEWER